MDRTISQNGALYGLHHRTANGDVTRQRLQAAPVTFASTIEPSSGGAAFLLRRSATISSHRGRRVIAYLNSRAAALKR